MRKGSAVRIGLIAAVAVACAALVPIAVASRPSTSGDPAPREIRIVVRGMTYYVDGLEASNPTLRFTAGERVRLVLRNDDAGMSHDLVIRDWNVATKLLDEKGEEDTVVFRVPGRRSPAAYQCTPHAEMMRGSVQVD